MDGLIQHEQKKKKPQKNDSLLEVLNFEAFLELPIVHK